MGKIKKITEVGVDVYPVTSTKAVYDEDNKRLDSILQVSTEKGELEVSTIDTGNMTNKGVVTSSSVNKIYKYDYNPSEIVQFSISFTAGFGVPSTIPIWITDGENLLRMANASTGGVRLTNYIVDASQGKQLWVQVPPSSGTPIVKAIVKTYLNDYVEELNTKVSNLQSRLEALEGASS